MERSLGTAAPGMDYKLMKQEESVLRRDTWLWRRNTKKQMPPFVGGIFVTYITG